MFALLCSLRDHRRLIRSFVARDLKARYVGSTMGFFWSVVFPIINLVIFMFVFNIIFKMRWGDQSPKETALIMLAGILVWSSFAETLSRTANSLVENSNLIQKVVFPAEILPLNLTLSSVVNMLIGMPIVLIGAWVLRGNPPGIQLVMVPVLILLQVLFTVGIGYFLATMNCLWRDTVHLVGVATMVWMFTTPIFYPPSILLDRGIPKSDDPADGQYTFWWMLEINPMHWLIESWRRVLLFDQWPGPDLLLRLTVVALLVFGGGAAFFMRQKKTFPDLL